MTLGEERNKEVQPREILEKKADYYFKTQEVVHIPFVLGHYKRGIIIELSSDFFMLDEMVDGIIPVFFLEIRDIRKFTSPENKERLESGKR